MLRQPLFKEMFMSVLTRPLRAFRAVLCLGVSLGVASPIALGSRLAQAGSCHCKKHATLANGLFVRLKAKPGKQNELAAFLNEGQKMAEAEDKTPLWFAVRFDEQTFAIFDAFVDESGRQAHLGGKIAAALMAQSPTLLAEPPVIEKFDVTGQKIHLK
jgi:quinol monooxygenase YgiN